MYGQVLPLSRSAKAERMRCVKANEESIAYAFEFGWYHERLRPSAVTEVFFLYGGEAMAKEKESCAKALGCNPIVYGISAGNIVAAILSAMHWHSLFWAIVNGFFGWVYVIYFVIKYT